MKNLFLCIFLLIFSHSYGNERISLNPSLAEPQIEISQEGSDVFRVDIQFPDLIISDTAVASQDWILPTMSGMGSSGEIGMPRLPISVRFLAVDGRGKFKAELITADLIEISGINVFPAQPRPTREAGENEFQIDRSTYQQDSWFPSEMVSGMDEAILREIRLLPVKIQPVQFHPVLKKLKIARSISFRVFLQASPGQNVLEPEPAILSRSYDPLYRSFIDNYHLSPETGREASGMPDMLIITHDHFYQEVVPFAEWKREKGIPCQIVRLSDIAANPTSTQIKNFIQSYYDAASDKPDFLLIVGDVTGSYAVPWFSLSGSMTDLPYYYLAGNDILPDIAGGRISVQTQSEANTVFTKLIRYEKQPAINSGSWYHSALVINSSDFQDPIAGLWARNRFVSYGYNPVVHLGDNLGNATAANVQSAVNTGVSYIYYIGHGSPSSWGTTGYSNTYIPQLTNGEMQPVISSVACNNADLDVSSDVFAEVWLKNNVDKGAVGILGFTESVSAYEPDSMARAMVRALLSDSIPMFGNMIDFGRLHMYQSFGAGCTDAMYQSLLVGEPSLQVWTKTPRVLSVNAPQVTFPGVTISVEVADSLGAVAGALVCYSDSLGNYARSYTDMNGTAVLDPMIMQPGSGMVTITAPNAVPVRRPVGVIPPAGPYVLVKDLVPVDTMSNHNQVVEAGEHFFLQLSLENIGIEPADNIRIHVSSADSFLTVLKDSSLFGTLSPSGTGIGGSLEAVVDSSCQHLHRIPLDILLEADGGHQWQQSVWLTVRTGARIRLSADTLLFPDTFLNHRSNRELMLSNDGPDTLRVEYLKCDLSLFDIGPEEVTVPPHRSAVVEIGFTPDSATFYETPLIVHSNDPMHFQREIILSGTGIHAPVISVTDSLLFVTGPVDSQEQTLRVQNDGPGELHFSLQVVGHNTGDQLAEGTGGTDTFGHIWVDSDEPNGPVFNWVHLPDTLVPLALTGNNSISNTVPLGFDFPFYGKEYSQFRVCSNGWISFTTFSVAYNNVILPDILAPRTLIAPLWDDLMMNQQSRVFVGKEVNKTSIEFRDFYRITGEGPYTFEVILYENGNIILQYLQLDSLNHDYTVGIQDHNAADGLTIAYNESYLKDSLAVMISRHSWLTAEPTAGVLAPGEMAEIQVTTKTNQFPFGDFYAAIEIESNDPDRNLVTIPVHLVVGATGLEVAGEMLPKRLELFQNYPNPFNPSTSIRYNLPAAADIQIDVYNLLGQKVRSLYSGFHEAGHHTIQWDGRNENGLPAGSGIYIYRLKTEKRSFVRKMILIK